ncbi:hypothetical protein BJ684DRAFT_20760 [Piptocephalis cylindrospora]|uniref:KIF-binding protein n=1 Tax=Piptocephalis cylindrospora TaxID=1907219 RepID=A0A4P9Y1R5_9FUNG|nr:hypothetical protein BJ684DRAFT_20760 [Piptocephalis cylindrospora]|eukprot:RKP12715.1 hypothetical protein BJ684DRAFT_20760 [Piptocephalis cylindrospora]
MAQKRKKPQGLLKSTLKKRAKEAERAKRAKEPKEGEEQQPGTVWVDDGEEEDKRIGMFPLSKLHPEVKEACLLYKTALDLLIEDPSRAISLLRGCVHELSRLFRAEDVMEHGEGRIAALSYYAMALCELAEADEEVDRVDGAQVVDREGDSSSDDDDDDDDDDEEDKEKGSSAQDWINTAKDLLPDTSGYTDGGMYAKIPSDIPVELALAHFRLALSQARLASMRGDASKAREHDKEAMRMVDMAFPELHRAPPQEDRRCSGWYMRVLGWYVAHLNLLDMPLNDKMRWIGRRVLSSPLFSNDPLIKGIPHAEKYNAWNKLAYIQLYFNFALGHVDELMASVDESDDDDDEDEDDNEKEEEEGEDQDDSDDAWQPLQTKHGNITLTKVQLWKVLNAFEKIHTEDLSVAERHGLLCILSETNLHLGNIADEQELQEKHYANCIALAKEAQALPWAGAAILPEGLVSFLNDEEEQEDE